MTSENSMMYMPVAPAYGVSNAGGFGLDGLGGGWGLLILLIVLFGGGRWGFGGFGGNGNGGESSALPWLMAANNTNTNNDVQRGFDQAAVISGLNGLQTSVTTGFAQAEIAANARQMADMQQVFALQTALQNCCCQQGANTADLKYTVATEACANRNALAMSTRDVIDNDNRNHQAVMDKLCQLEMDGYKQQLGAANDTISQLRTQLLVANNTASQNEQTAAIQAGQRALANEVEQYLNPTPRPAWIVQNPNCCAQNYYGCGCGNA